MELDSTSSFSKLNDWRFFPATPDAAARADYDWAKIIGVTLSPEIERSPKNYSAAGWVVGRKTAAIAPPAAAEAKMETLTEEQPYIPSPPPLPLQAPLQIPMATVCLTLAMAAHHRILPP
ncbi:Uncharacterized protein Fot_32501 [Forsythia ovata]|uniref:Uncharacterized protein n=1 Tax=Forsythia ovata TaxID=205694 RepID=A0ABD1T831_9LAMI